MMSDDQSAIYSSLRASTATLLGYERRNYAVGRMTSARSLTLRKPLKRCAVEILMRRRSNASAVNTNGSCAR
jgi:hypothetical protein